MGWWCGVLHQFDRLLGCIRECAVCCDRVVVYGEGALASSDSASGIRLGASGQPYHAPRANCLRSAYNLRLLDLVEWEATKGVEHGRRTWSLRASLLEMSCLTYRQKRNEEKGMFEEKPTIFTRHLIVTPPKLLDHFEV